MRNTPRLFILSTVVALSVAACGGPSPTGSPSEVPTVAVSPSELTPSAMDTVGTPSATVSPTPSATVSPSPSPTLISDPQPVTTGLQAPWSVVFRDDVPLVSERDSGRILELAADGNAREVAVIEQVVSRGEGGLLGLAVDEQGRLYAYYTAADDNRIVRFDVSGTAGELTLGEPQVILDGLEKSATHNGGRIAFGPDGMLYVTVGDAGMPDRAQSLESLSGKILRMTADGGVPPDNPFDASLVWTWGHRNPQGIAWTDDGVMFATEFGQDTWDELNIIEPGNNYGWPVVEGAADNEEFTNPVQQWPPREASPSGMAYADGTLFIANLRGRLLRTVPVADPSTSSVHWEGQFGRLRHVAVTPDGYLWILTNNTDGRGRPVEGDDRIVVISPEAFND